MRKLVAFGLPKLCGRNNGIATEARIPNSGPTGVFPAPPSLDIRVKLLPLRWCEIGSAGRGGCPVRVKLCQRRLGGICHGCGGRDPLVRPRKLLEFAQRDVEAVEGILACLGDLAGVVGGADFDLEHERGTDNRDDEEREDEEGNNQRESLVARSGENDGALPD